MILSNESIHGSFYGYYVFYRRYENGVPLEWHNVGTRLRSITLDELTPGSQYGIRMLVSVSHGNGIASRERIVRTIEGGKFKFGII